MAKFKRLVLILAWLSSFTTSAWASGAYVAGFKNQDIFATKVDKDQNLMQIRLDYTGTTSGCPIYVGFAAQGVASSTAAWRIYKFTDSSAGPTLRQGVDDSIWDNRAALSYS